MRFIDNAKIIRGTYDTKAMLMGGGNAVRLKAEVDIDGRELTRRYLETMPLSTLLAVSKISSFIAFFMAVILVLSRLGDVAICDKG